MSCPDDPYAYAVKTSLKMKSDGKIKKKKKKDKKDKITLEQVTKSQESTDQKPEVKEPSRTKAEMAFQKQQEKMKMQKILEKASMTHKQRVEKFNQHLDSLTEHFDIPKVSWTK